MQISLTGINIDTVRLSLVLGDFVMNKGDDVWPHRGSEHSRETDGSARTLVLLGIDADQWAGRCERLKKKTKITQFSKLNPQKD